MNDRIYLLVRYTVSTKHQIIHEAIAEFQEQTQLKVTDTPNVKVLLVEIVKMNTKGKKG